MVNYCMHFFSIIFHSGDPIILTCEVSVGNEENIGITWYNSKTSIIVGLTKELDLSNFKLPASEPSYTAEYWCLARNSDGTGRSQNVTVHIISSGKSILSIVCYIYELKLVSGFSVNVADQQTVTKIHNC